MDAITRIGKIEKLFQVSHHSLEYIMSSFGAGSQPCANNFKMQINVPDFH